MEIFRKNNTRVKVAHTYLTKMGLAIYSLLLPVIVLAQKDTIKTYSDSARAFAQQDSAQQKIFYDSVQTDYDSAATKFYGFFRKFGSELQKKNMMEYMQDTISARQDGIIEEIKRITLEAENYLNRGLDTTGLSNELSKTEKWYRIASDGIFINKGSIQTHRNLETSYQILRELSTRTLARKESLDNYYRNLVNYRNTIDSLYQEKVLYKFPIDSVAAMRYVNKLIVILEEVKPIDSALKKTMINVAELQTTINRFVNILNSSIEKIGDFQKDLSGKIFDPETSKLGGPVKSYRPLKDIFRVSITKAALSLVFYTGNTINRLLLLLAFFLVCAMFFVNLKKNLRSKGLLTEETAKRSVIQHPILSAFVIALNILQFIFVDPPFAFNALLWIISSVTLIIIARKQIPKYWMIAWYVMFGLFLFACANNLILQASRPERWMMLGLSIAGVLGGTVIILTEPKNELREKIIIYFVAFLIIMQLISIFTNINGRYNFAKTSLTSGYFNIIIAILFFWTIRLINEGLSLASKAYKVPGKKLFRINFDRIGNKAPRIFYVLLVIGWFVLFARNFYAHKIISEPIKDFVYRERTIGEFSFTIGSMLLFFLILYLTSFISRLVSFFALDSQNKTNDSGSRKSGLGSWILVVRISIIVIGFLLALAAIGLPMDRLTIVLSALGVGIGFGLQTLVNNLVSGLIISFEKPVSVGDIVEVSGQLGTIKSIGFRSSIISSGNGSDVIIPNGDLLNRHLVNWSRDGNSKSVDIITTVAHGTDLEKTIRILKAIPANDKRVLTKPEPSVLIKDFNAQGIDMQLSLRVENIQEVARVKSDMILAIDAAFRENSIEVPVSRQSVTIQSKEK